MTTEGREVERFDTLYRANYNAVLRYVQRRSDEAFAQDVTSDVFLTAWRRLKHVPAEPLPWLIGVARRTLANHRRGAAREGALRIKLAGEREPSYLDPMDALDATRRWSHALSSLAPRDQEVLALVAWDGLTSRQAAESLGCTAAAFGMRLVRARRHLRRALQDQERPRKEDLIRVDSAPAGQTKKGAS